MSELKFVELKCQRCGGDLSPAKGNIYRCTHCGKPWKEVSLQGFKDIIDGCQEALRRQRVMAVANQRQRYTQELNRNELKGEYASFNNIAKCCNKIKDIIPDDFYADFFLSATSDKKYELGNFLQGINLSEHEDDVAYILEFLIKYMKGIWLDGVGRFIERLKDDGYFQLYNTYCYRYEKVAKDIREYVFDPTLTRDVFIAYSSSDLNAVEKLVSKLEERNLKCYYSARNLSKNADDYGKDILTAIKNCKLLVFVSSKKSRDFLCDAHKELNDIKDCRPDMPRVQYLIEMYDKNEPGKDFYDNFFGTRTWKTSEDDVVNYVYTKLLESESYSGETLNSGSYGKTALSTAEKPQVDGTLYDPDDFGSDIDANIVRSNSVKLTKSKKKHDKWSLFLMCGGGVVGMGLICLDYYVIGPLTDPSWLFQLAAMIAALVPYMIFTPVCGEYNKVRRIYKKGQKAYYKKKDYSWAYWKYEEAARKGLDDAQASLGYFYLNGIHVKKDVREAVKWYHLAAEQGHYIAQYQLAEFYEKGIGVAQNKSTALRWYQKSSENGYKEADNKLRQWGY